MRAFHLTRRRSFAPQIVQAQPQNLRPTFPATLQLPNGVTENRVTGRTEGNPFGLVTRAPLNTGGTVYNNVDTEAKLRTALQGVAASSTHDIIVLTGDFEVAPGFSFPDRLTNTLTCDIVAASVYAGTFPQASGTRVASSASLVTLTRGLSPDGNGVAAFDLGRGAGRNTGLSSGWRFIGVRFRTHPSQSQLTFYYFMAGSEGSAQNSITKTPQNVRFERCIFDGGATCENKGGLCMFVRRSSVVDCRFENWWALAPTWGDVSAIVSWNTDGGNVIENNYLDSSGENMMIGGGVQSVGVNNADWVFRRNHVEKNYALYHGKGVGAVVIKNLSETKQVSRYVIEDNYFINSWHENVGSQDGAALVYKMQDYGSPGHDAVSDNLLFRGNYVRNFAVMTNLLGDQGSPEDSPNQLGEIHFIDNVFDGWNETPFNRTPRGVLLSGPGSPAPPLGQNNYGNLSFTHNTIVGKGNYSNGTLITFANSIADGSIPSFVFDNNVAILGQYGIFGTPGEGTGSLNTYCASYSIGGNVLVRTFGNNTALYPAGNFFVSDLTSVYDAGDVSANTWQLSAAYANRLAPDGFTRGVSDYTYFMSRLAGVL